MSDVTRPQRAEWAQRESERRYRTLVENASDALLAVDQHKRRGDILEAAAFAAERFLSSPPWEEAIEEVLARLGRAARASRTYVLRAHAPQDGAHPTAGYFEWAAEGIGPRGDGWGGGAGEGLPDGGGAGEGLPDGGGAGEGPPDGGGEEGQGSREEAGGEVSRWAGWSGWEQRLRSGELIHCLTGELPPRERSSLESQGVLSVAMVPIFAGPLWWGLIGLDDGSTERRWSAVELDALRAAADIIGATIQRQGAEEALHEGEDRYRRLVELSPDAIVVHKQGRIVFANPAAARLLRARADDLLGHSVLEFIHPDSRPQVLERMQRLREGRAVPLIAERFLRMDGTSIQVDVAATPFVHEGETAVQVVARDATDRLRAEEELRASEERYRRLVELSPDAIIVHGGGILLFANRAMARLIGVEDPSELIGRPILEFIHPDYRAVIEQRAREQTEGKESAPLEEKVIRRDGTVIDVEAAGIPVTFQGKPAGQVVIRDITDRKRAETALTRRNEYLAALHQTSLGLMDRLDVQETLHAIVARAAGLMRTQHGYMYLVDPAQDEIVVRVGLGAFLDWSGYRMKRGEGMAGKVWESGEPLVVDEYDSWMGRSPGFAKGIFRAVAGVPLKSGNEVIGILGLAYVEEGRSFDDEDLTVLTQFAALASLALDNAHLYTEVQRELAERRRSEEQLREAEQKYRTLVEQVPAITYIDAFDEAGQFADSHYYSPQVEAMLGRSAEELMASPELWDSLVHPEDRDRVREAEHHHYSTHEPLGIAYRLIAADGHIVWVLDQATVVEDGSGRPMYSQGMLYDITDRMRAQEELERALRIEREAGERLRAVDEMKTTFLHAVSHELRTPLSAVLGLALTLEREEVELPHPERQDLVRRLAANARKLDQLLSDLLDLDRLDRGIVEPRRRPTDVAALVRRVVENSDVLGTRPVRVDADLVVVAIDAPKVERIVENLVVNAARHTPPDCTIWVRVGPEQGGVLIAVEDEGPGIPEHLRESIFEPFLQGPSAPKHSPGVGIGLSLVARFAELHGGRAWVEERPGGGASFKVLLPGGSA